MDRRKRRAPARNNRWSPDYGGWPERTKPRKVEGGVKAHTKRGAFGQQWWAKRWIGVLESFGLGPRLSRGRSYARGGQVCEIAIERGGVRALVQGSRAQPYAVTLRMREFSPREWAAIGAAIAANARLCAKLLAGEMPADIEAAFGAAGASLFPQAANELKMACSCPDWSNPCKHVAAVFYLVGEEFDRDPFLLFVARGLERDAIAPMLAGTDADEEPTKRPVRQRVAKPNEGKPKAAQSDAPVPTESFVLEPASFWTGPAVTPAPAARATPPTGESLLVKRAGRFPFWRSSITLDEAVCGVYARATQHALEWLAEHPEPEPRE